MSLGLLVTSFIALVYFSIGLIFSKSDKPVGFFTGVKVPKITDAQSYNKAVSNLFFKYAIVVEIYGIVLQNIKNEIYMYLGLIPLTVFSSIAMMIEYTIIINKYSEK